MADKKSSEVREYQTANCGIFFVVRKHLYKGESPFQKIEVFENEDFGHVLMLDGLVQTTDRDEFYYHEMIVHPPLVTHPDPRNVLIIGGGDGGALREVLRYGCVEHAWLVEIDSQVVEVARTYFPWLKPALKDPRSELVVDDGVRFIAQTGHKFDVVIIDSSDPVGPSSPLHSREFYESLKKRLNTGAIVTAQVGSPLFHLDFIEKKYRFFQDLFPIARTYLGPTPTYPGGSWCYVFLSDGISPFDPKREPPSGLKIFNAVVLRAAFDLPNFLRERLEPK